MISLKEIQRATPPEAGKLDLQVIVLQERFHFQKVTVSRNEILTGLNTLDNFILAVVLIDGENAMEPVYIRKPFDKEPDFNAHSVNYKLRKLISKGSPPS